AVPAATCRWTRASRAAKPRSRSGLTTPSSPKEAVASAGRARTSPAGAPSRVAWSTPANPRVTGACGGAAKCSRTTAALPSPSTSASTDSGDWHSVTRSSGWERRCAGSSGSSSPSSASSWRRSAGGSAWNSATSSVNREGSAAEGISADREQLGGDVRGHLVQQRQGGLAELEGHARGRTGDGQCGGGGGVGHGHGEAAHPDLLLAVVDGIALLAHAGHLLQQRVERGDRPVGGRRHPHPADDLPDRLV